MRVSEIFSSIQGEAKYTGYPTTFIRLSGCPLKCSYCDTKHEDGKEMSIDKIVSVVYKMKNTHVCITGGEPLIQDDATTLIYELVGKNYIVNVETSGAIELDRFSYTRTAFSYTMDLKAPSSKMQKHMIFENLLHLQPVDEVKVVVTNARDYEWARDILKAYPTKASIIFSPVYKSGDFVDYKWLINKMHSDPVPNSRIGIQLHRILNVE